VPKSQVLLFAVFLFLGKPASEAASLEPVLPQDPESRPQLKPAKEETPEWMRPWLQEIGAMIGYGLAHEIFGTRDGRRQYLILNPRWGMFLTGVIGKVPYKGALEFLVEPIAMFQFEPNNRYALGLSALLRYNFWTPSRRVTPFFDAGGGVMWTNLGLPDLGSNFNFQLQFGPGLHVHFNRGTALTFQYRFHHISNAETAKPNFSINSSLLLIGVTFFLL